jgi:penicillin amidase
MPKGWRIFLGIVVFFIIVLAAVTFFSYRLLTKSLPQTEGNIQLALLEKPVHVYRDEYGVPHIFAEGPADLFRAAGYVTAQDRLWQMDMNRRIAAGRLSELFGRATLETDRFLRMWGFARIATDLVATMSADSRMALEAYTDGINGFIESHQDRLPVEFSLLRYKPEKWRVEDSIAFTRLMAWRLSFSWYVDPVLAELVEKMGDAKAREIFPDFPREGPLIIQQSVQPFWTEVQPFLENGLAVRDFLGITGGQVGSNSWVVSGEKSKCGKPLLANDPHLELNAPSIWYEMHLSCDEFNVIGVALPGTPGILIGHNEDIAWGLTNGMLDDVDFYIEKINPENPNQYWDGKSWLDFQTIAEEIAVKDSTPVALEIKSTRNGTIISSVHPSFQGSERVVAMRWTGQQPSDEMAALLKLQKAKTWLDFTDAVSYFKTPAQNFVFASASGDIGYYLGGAIPIRKNATGLFPHNGWEEKGQWSEFVPFEKQPHVLNPPENYIATANNKIIDDRYPFYLTNLWEPASRADRINQVLQAKEKLSLADFRVLQTDIVSTYAQKMLPLVLETATAELDSTKDENLRIVYDLLKDWDGRESAESIATSLFNAFTLKLIENTFKDEMGTALYENYIRLGNIPTRVIATLLENERSTWFDDVETLEIEGRREMIVRALHDGQELLKTLAGDLVSDWAWGRIHTLTMDHPMGRQKPLDFVFNLGPFPRGGSKMTVNNSEYSLRRPFAAGLGASTRQLVDFCDLHNSLSVITTGQSGHPLSEHYKDQTPLWLEGNYHRSVMDRVEIEQTARSHLTFTP